MSSSALQYQVRWRAASDPDTQWSSPVAVGADGAINVPGLTNVDDYMFQARARSGCGAWSAWVVQTFNHPTQTYPAPSLPDVSGVPDGVHVVFGPDPQSGDLWYEIQRAPDNAGTPGTWATVAKTQSTVWDDVVTDTNQYWYRFRTIDYQGNASDWVMISNPVTVSVSTPAINEEIQAANAAIGQTQQDVTNLQTQADSTLAQVQTIQGQVGDILQADVYDSTKTYPKGDLVQESGKLYRSLIDGNTGNDPATSPTAWSYIGNYASLGEAVGANAAQVAVLNNTVTQQGDTLTANSQSIAQNAAALGTKADSSALQATNATVTQQGDTLTSQGQSLTALTNTVNDPNTGLGTKASSAALTSLSNTVTQQGSDITANEASITSVQGSVGDVNSRVDAEQSARQSGDAANAQSIIAVNAQLGDAGNIVKKSSFADGSAGPWNGTMMTIPIAIYGRAHMINWITGGGAETDSHRFPASPGDQFDVSMYVWSNGGGGSVYLAFNTAIDGSGADTWLTAFDIPASVGPVVLSGRVTAPAGAQSAVLYGLRNGGTVQDLYFDNPSIRRVTVAEEQNAQAILNMQANVTANGQPYAQATLMVDASGNVALMRMNADGTTSNIVFKADTVSIVGSSAAGSTTFAGGLMTVKDSSGTTLIQIGLLP